MQKAELIERVLQEGADVVFLLNGKRCGLRTEVKNGVFSFEAWCGGETREYEAADIAAVIADPFFDGRSLGDLLETTEVRLI